MKTNQFKEFEPIFYAKYRVEGLLPNQLDGLLANGWARNNQWVYSSPVRFMGDGWRSSVMLRLPLAGFTWKKRLRKLLRQNGERYTWAVRPFRQTAEKEVLWQHFKSTVHHWKYVPNLSVHIFLDASPADFNTWELEVYHQGKLVAFSIFDLGAQSIASLEAAYDTGHSKHSLGLYTMLLEIEHGQSLGLGHYYPGFFPRGVAMFDYKLRPGGMEFFRYEEKKWLPVEVLSESDWLCERVAGKLEALDLHLQPLGLRSVVVFCLYGHQPTGMISPKNYNLLAVVPMPTKKQGFLVFIAWDVRMGSYLAFLAQPSAEIGLNLLFEEPPRHLFQLSNDELIGATSNPAHLPFFLSGYF